MICVVALGGTKGTLNMVLNSLRNGTPVVLVTGIGFYPTDILAFAVRRTRPTLPAKPLEESGPGCVTAFLTDFEFLFEILQIIQNIN